MKLQIQWVRRGPAHRPDAAYEDRRDSVPSLETHSYLIVDDEAFTCHLVEQILARNGARCVRSARSGAAALRALDERGPDVILCDLNMPEMDGLELLRHLAERGYDGGVILMSGEDRRILDAAREVAHARSLKVLGVVAKPLCAGALVSAIGRMSGGGEPPVARPATVAPEDLAAALDAGAIYLHYQPKVSVASGELVGVEALARWSDPERGFIPPDVFVAVAEASGQIGRLTETIFDRAMRQGAAWRRLGLDLKIAVNTSMDDFARPEFADFVIGAIGRAGMRADRVVLEVTETRLMSETAVPLETLARLRIKGISLSIDDFGTGHSSLQQLKRIPFTELKVDRAFVSGVAKDEIARSILEASVKLAKRLSMVTVAEGVETVEDWNFIASLGVDQAQGYYLSRPLPPEAVPDWAVGRGRTAHGGAGGVAPGVNRE